MRLWFLVVASLLVIFLQIFLYITNVATNSPTEPKDIPTTPVVTCPPPPELPVQQPEPYYHAHIAFSTDCSNYLNWQSVGLIESWLELNKPFNLTRIVTCDETLPQSVLTMQQAYPDVTFFQTKTPLALFGDTMKELNKPVGVYQWIHEAQINEDYVIILDADWILLQPFDIRGVARGRPLSAYGLEPSAFRGAGAWKTFCGDVCENVTRWSEYAVGHVYVAHKEDMKLLATGWMNWTMKIRKSTVVDGGRMVDMFGYILGALEYKLPHDIRLYFDTSSADDPKLAHLSYVQALHYCQTYKDGSWHWSKYQYMQTKLLECGNNVTFPLPPHMNSTNMFSVQLTTHQYYLTLATTLNRAFVKYRKRVCKD